MHDCIVARCVRHKTTRALYGWHKNTLAKTQMTCLKWVHTVQHSIRYLNTKSLTKSIVFSVSRVSEVKLKRFFLTKKKKTTTTTSNWEKHAHHSNPKCGWVWDVKIEWSGAKLDVWTWFFFVFFWEWEWDR